MERNDFMKSTLDMTLDVVKIRDDDLCIDQIDVSRISHGKIRVRLEKKRRWKSEYLKIQSRISLIFHERLDDVSHEDKN